MTSCTNCKYYVSENNSCMLFRTFLIHEGEVQQCDLKPEADVTITPEED